MSVEVAQKNTITELNDEFSIGSYQNAICSYLMLRFAESDRVVGRGWRRSVDCDAYEQWLASEENRALLSENWEQVLGWYVRDLHLINRAEDHDLLSLLERRDSLELIARLLDEDRIAKISSYDDELRMILDENIGLLQSIRSQFERLQSYIPNHWWWRYEPSKGTK